MNLRPSTLLGALVLAAAGGPFLGATAAYADAPAPYNATINQGNVPATAAQYSQGCDEFAGKPADSDGWLFVASPSNFTDFEGIFDNGKVVTLNNGNNPAGTSASFAKANDHLAVITPAGWTLQQAYANLDGDRDFFTLSHTCAAGPAAPEAGGTGGDDQGGGDDAVGPGSGGGDDQGGGGDDSTGPGNGGGDDQGGGDDAVGPDTGVGGDDGGAGAGPGEDVGTSGQSGQAGAGGAVARTPAVVLGERMTRSAAAGASRSGSANQSGTTSSAGAGGLPFTGTVVADVAPVAGVVVCVGIGLCWVGRRPRRRMQA